MRIGERLEAATDETDAANVGGRFVVLVAGQCRCGWMVWRAGAGFRIGDGVGRTRLAVDLDGRRGVRYGRLNADAGEQ